MENQEEIWKDIDGYEGIYYVSNHGRIKSFKRNKKGTILKKGSQVYHTACLCNTEQKQKYVHVLTAEHFIDNPLNKKHVNHKDGDKLNNNVPNLEWATKSEDVKHAHRTGLKEAKKGGANISSVSVDQFSKEGIYINSYNSIAEASDDLLINRSHIAEASKGKRKSAGGFVWKRY